MELNKTFKVDTVNVITEMFGDECVLLNFDSGNYYSLKKTSSYIFHLVANDASYGQIITKMKEKFDIPGDINIEDDVEKFIFRLLEEKIIFEGGNEQPVESLKLGPVPEEKLVYDTPDLQIYDDMQKLLLLDPIHKIEDTEEDKNNNDQ